jgi:hypothetical protein
LSMLYADEPFTDRVLYPVCCPFMLALEVLLCIVSSALGVNGRSGREVRPGYRADMTLRRLRI